MYKKNNTGQSTVEYVLLVAAVIAVMIAFLVTGGGFQGHISKTLNASTNQVNSVGKGLSKAFSATASGAIVDNTTPKDYSMNSANLAKSPLWTP